MSSQIKKGINPRIIISIIAALIFLLVPAITTTSYWLNMIIMSAIGAILCMGWVLILRVGQFSLGQAAFLGIGAYTSAILATRIHFNFWICLLAGGIIAALFALAVGVIVLRLRGLYFAVVSFAFAEAIRLLTVNWRSFLGGYDGIVGIARPALPGISFAKSVVPYYYLIVGLMIVCGVVMWRLESSRIGRTFRAVGKNRDLAQSLGIPAMRTQVTAFVIACFFAGLAGSFLAHYHTIVYPDSFGLAQSIMVQIKATVGGVGAIVAGPVLGSFILTISGELLRGYMSALEPLIFGVLIIAVVFFLPGGAASLGDIFIKLKNRK